MKTSLAGKMSYFILTFIFLIIIASFLFSGFDNFSLGGSQNVATVDGTPITRKEYQMALSRQVEFFNQMMGGKGITERQLTEMGIKDSVLDGLIQQKLILNTAKEMGIVVSLEEVKEEIKSLPYFKTNDRFDVNLYRNALQANGYTPTQFEQLVRNDLMQKKVDELFNNVLVSEDYAQDVVKFKNNTVTIHAVKIGRQALSPLITVSEKEIQDYLSKPENMKALESAYTENASKYNRAEEVKARHILITGDDEKSLQKIKDIRSKVSPKNFAAVAAKETQDPTGQGTGGDLGWFSAGRMVPEFEEVAFKLPPGTISEPVKTQFGYHLIYVEDKRAAEVRPLEAVKEELARFAIQRTKPQDLDKLLQTEKERLVQALEKGNLEQVEKTAQQVNGEFYKSTKVNQFEQNLPGTSIGPDKAQQIFSAEPGSVLNFSDAGSILLVKVVSQEKAPAQISADEVKKEWTSLNQTLSRKVREELIRTMNNKAKVVTNRALL